MKACYIIAEAGVNHNGDESIAMQLVEQASKTGANAVKFQTFKAESIVTKYAETAQYQKSNTGNKTQFGMLKSLEISEGLHRKLLQRCNELNIDFLSTPFDIDSAHFLVGLGIKKIKVSSGDITHLPFLKQLAEFNLPIILSTGMSELFEINEAITSIKDTREAIGFKESLGSILSLLHCTSNYPADFKDANLNAIKTIAKAFSLPVGYSDHTLGNLASIVAVSMGSKIIEKHFTIDKNMSGPDHETSLDPSEFKEMVDSIRKVELLFGHKDKKPTGSEISVRSLVRRSIVWAVEKSAGQIIKHEDLICLRPGDGLAPKNIEIIIGKTINANVKAGALVRWDEIIK